MCGRYTGYVDECEELKTIYTEAVRRYPGVKFHSGEIFPTNTVPLLTGQREGLAPVPGTWGYPGYNGKGVIINARAETAGVKPTFADSLRYRRCVVPTTGYFEWSGEKRKFLFRQPNRTILYLAGLYREYTDGVRFVILTTAANASTADVHPRMPVVLEEDMLEVWECDTGFAEWYLRQAMPWMTRVEA